MHLFIYSTTFTRILFRCTRTTGQCVSRPFLSSPPCNKLIFMLFRSFALSPSFPLIMTPVTATSRVAPLSLHSLPLFTTLALRWHFINHRNEFSRVESRPGRCRSPASRLARALVIVSLALYLQSRRRAARVKQPRRPDGHRDGAIKGASDGCHCFRVAAEGEGRLLPVALLGPEAVGLDFTGQLGCP